jgi:CheY-specific phosphatase CheX
MSKGKMKAENINPFIESIENTFSSMVGVQVERNGALAVNTSDFKSNDELFSSVKLTGSVDGAVVMVMNGKVARNCVRCFLDEKMITDEDLIDGFGELLNMIVGSAIAKLTSSKANVPEISFGRKEKIYKGTQSAWIVIPMKFPDWGEFTLEVSMNG